jgi:hypothetical protein
MSKQAIRVHMDEALVAEVDEQAAREDRSRNWTINDLVRRGLAEVQTQERILAEQESLAAVDVYHDAKIQRDPEFQREVDQRIQQAAIKPTLDERRASSSRSGPAGIETLPKPHRHRFQIEVANTRRGKAGRQVADYACDCGEIKKEQPVK